MPVMASSWRTWSARMACAVIPNRAGDRNTAAASDVQDLPPAGNALQQGVQPGAVPVRGVVIAAVSAGDA
jgi:hypothetical protein